MDLNSFSASTTDVDAFYRSQDERPKKQIAKHPKHISADLPRHGKGERFIGGPIPMAWMSLAARCGHRAVAVGVLLWYAAGWQRSNPVKLTKSILSELGVHPKTAKRVLHRMENAGLVQAEFHRGRSPMVTITSAHERLVE